MRVNLPIKRILVTSGAVLAAQLVRRQLNL
jgi:hypothetical protein